MTRTARLVTRPAALAVPVFGVLCLALAGGCSTTGSTGDRSPSNPVADKAEEKTERAARRAEWRVDQHINREIDGVVDDIFR